jgi:hypothetical protein
MYRLQNQIDRNKWKVIGSPYPTATAALDAAAQYDEDGYVHPKLWRVIDSAGTVVLTPEQR